MKNVLILAAALILVFNTAKSQSCTPQGNQTTFGTNNVWRGYVYDNADFTSYKGYVTEGTASSPNFNEGFGGDNVTYATNGCSINTTTFSVRYKLRKNFTNANYEITVGGDDGYRLSIDGGSTWLINKWYDQSYTTTTTTVLLNGSVDLVLEFYENGGANRVSFNITSSCAGTENTATYGNSNKWNGYVYTGTNFNAYRGMIQEGTVSNPNFDENFGGANTTFATSSCPSVTTEGFSVRYRLTKTFTQGQYVFFVGGDDGYRLSLDGGTTWVINKWADQSYNVSSYTATLSGSYNMVLEYYENSGDNRINFNVQANFILPIKLLSFTGKEENNKISLAWRTAAGSNPDHFAIERSADAVNFNTIASIKANAALNYQADISFRYTDEFPLNGKSFYRLKMTDETGVVSYSSIISIQVKDAKTTGITVFPTLVSNSTVSLRSAAALSQATVIISDATGRSISKKEIGKLPAGQTVNILLSANHIEKGIYFVQVSDNNQQVATKKIIVQ